ncbi:hypothetical protein Hanom_Chr15g01365741 [Helianthus anomalus]
MRLLTQLIVRLLASLKVQTLVNNFNPQPYLIKSSMGISKSSGNKPLRRKTDLSSSF